MNQNKNIITGGQIHAQNVHIGDDVYITQTSEQHFNIEILLSLIDRYVQDEVVVDVCKKSDLLAAIIHSTEDHLPHFYIKRLIHHRLNIFFPNLSNHTLPRPKYIHYRFPSQYNGYAEFKSLILNELRNRYGGQHEKIISHLRNQNNGHLIFHSSIQSKDFLLKRERLLEHFVNFWKEHHVANFPYGVAAILVVYYPTPGSFFNWKANKTGKIMRETIHNWGGKTTRSCCVPELNHITEADIEDWIHSPEFQESPLSAFSVNYRDRLLALFKKSRENALKRIDQLSKELFKNLQLK